MLKKYVLPIIAYLGITTTAQQTNINSITVNLPELYSQSTTRILTPILEEKNLENYLDGTFQNGEAIQAHIKTTREGYVLTLNVITEEELKQYDRTIFMNGSITNTITPKSISFKLDYKEGSRLLQELYEKAKSSSSIREAYNNLQLQIKGLEEQIKTLTENYNEKNTLLNLNSLKIEELKKQTTTLYKELESLKGITEKTFKKNDFLEEEQNKTEKTIHNIINLQNNLRTTINTKIESLEEKTNIILSSTRRNTEVLLTFKNNLEETNNNIEELKKQYEQLQLQLTNLQKNFSEEKLERLKQKYITNEELERKIENLEREMDFYKIGTLALSGIALLTSILALAYKKRR